MTGAAGINRSGAVVRTALHDHWKLFLVEGVVLLILGLGAIIVPVIAGLAMAIFLGWLFLVGGVVGLAATIVGRRAPGFWWSLLSAILTIIVGCFLIFWPIGGAISLTLALTIFLLADGVFMIFFAIDHRRQLSRRWGFLLANGILDILLAGVIVLALPVSAAWALGLIVGVDLVFGGLSLVTMALAARSAEWAPT